jgi:hypothetical protein
VAHPAQRPGQLQLPGGPAGGPDPLGRTILPVAAALAGLLSAAATLRHPLRAAGDTAAAAHAVRQAITAPVVRGYAGVGPAERPFGWVSSASEQATGLHAVRTARLERVVRHALGSRTARLGEWEWHALPYHSVLPGRTLARVTGWALVDGQGVVPWSSVVKAHRRTALDEAGAVASGTRELLAYRSGLLLDLPGPLRAPRVLGIDEDEAAVRLWLEDVEDIYARRWPLEQFGLAARHLGLFNGAYLVSRALPTDPWLNHWLGQHQAELHAGLERSPTYRELQQLVRHPLVQRLLGATIATRAARLVHDQARFVNALSRLPRTLCHHESSLANLFAVRRADGQLETVAVDWEQVGPAALGADIATLVFGTLRRCEFDAERATELDEAVFAGYVAGLRDAGWRGRAEEVRLGFTGAVGLRWGVLASLLRGIVEGGVPVRTSQGADVAPDAVVSQWARLSAFLLDRADEARRLATEMS